MGVCRTKFVKHHRFADTKFRSQHLKSQNPCLTKTAYSPFPYVFCQTNPKVLGYAHPHFTPLRCLTFFACQFCPTFFACDCRRVFCYAAQSRCLFRSARGVPAALRLRRRGRALSARAPTAARSCESCARAELAVPRRCCACSARAAKEDSLFCASVSGN